MPPIDEHIKKSIERTGRDYREIHEWIDEPAKKYERHHITKIIEYGKMFEQRYGKEGAEEYLQHIHDDIQTRFTNLTDELKMVVIGHLKYFGVK